MTTLGDLWATNKPAGAKPTINIRQQPSIVAYEARNALKEYNDAHPSVFVRAGHVVRVVRDLDDADNVTVYTKPYDGPSFKGEMGRVADWVTKGEKGEAPCAVPQDMIGDLLGNVQLMEGILPELHQIVRSPVFTAGGGLHLKAGYFKGSKCWYEPHGGLELDDVPDDPSENDLALARKIIMDELLGDFPFETEADKSNAVALLLQPFARRLISGPTPLHLVDAPAAGTGKSLLVDAIMRISNGAAVTSMVECVKDEEWKKVLTAKFMSGQPIIFIDNISRTVDSPSLASALTQPMWEDRVLGGSSMFVGRIQHTWVATGNNVSMSGEIARRTVRTRLNAHSATPYEGRVFKHSDLLAWVGENRGALVWSALVLVRNWLALGRPVWSGKPLASYESWGLVMGGILEAAGISGFLDNRAEMFDASNESSEEMRAFTEAWFEAHGEAEMAARDLVDLAGVHLGLVKPGLAGIVKPSSKSVASALSRAKGCVFGDLEVVKIFKKGKADKYRLKKVS